MIAEQIWSQLEVRLYRFYGDLSYCCKQLVFYPSIYGLSAKGKKLGSVTHGTDREDEVSKIFIISLGSKRCGRFQSSETAIDD